MKKKVLICLFVFVIAVTTATAQTLKYTVTDLYEVGFSQVSGINNACVVAGSSYVSTTGTYQACTYTLGHGKVYIELPEGCTSSRAYAINNAGQVAGTATASDGTTEVWVYTPGVGVSVIATGTDLGVKDINNLGQVVYYGSGKNYLYTPGGQTVEVPINAYAINDSGVITGHVLIGSGTTTIHAATHSIDGGLLDLGILPGAYRSAGNDINNAGQVVGFSDPGHLSKAIIYNPGSGMSMIEDNAYVESVAYGINNNSWVVGYYNAYGGGKRAFLNVPGTGMVYLNSSLSPLNPRWSLERATAINDSGWIVGYGWYTEGKQVPFLLTPVPEPSSFICLASGAGLLLGLCKRRK